MSDLYHRLRTLLFLVPYVHRNRGVLLSELAERLDLNEEQLLKEIDFLMLVGRPPFLPNDLIDIYVDNGRVFVDLPQSLDTPPQLTVFEALALAAAAQLFAESGREDALPIRQALQKILASLDESTQRLFGKLQERYLVVASPASKHLEIIQKAIAGFHEVELTHYSAGRGEVKHRTVQPYGLGQRLGVWYLVARCMTMDSLRVFRLSRIHEARVTNKRFQPPTEFDPGRFLDENLTVPQRGSRKVVLRFEPEVVRWVRERWSGEYLKEQPDGSILANLYDVSDEYVLAYAASFGGRASIESPPELLDKLRRQAARALSNYT